MQVLDWNSMGKQARAQALARPGTGAALETVREAVAAIIHSVRTGGDAALAAASRRFDGIAAEPLCASQDELDAAWQALDERERVAMDRAATNIRRFHEAQRAQDISVEVEPGLLCTRRMAPLDCIGIYVPGGTAPLFSSLLMAAIPAQVAGVRRILVASPPGTDGRIAPVVLAAAKLAGVREVFAMGGAQAIAAFAFGTKSVPKADKIFGPGNQWVAEAKAQVAQMPGGPAIDLPAGPSEVMVLADGNASAALVASDLLSQAEHDAQAQVILLSTSKKCASAVREAVLAQVQTLPRHKIANAALQNARLIVVENKNAMLNLVNRYGPEHLIIQMQNAEELAAAVRHAGSIFIGASTPEALGDYASGANHVLPTGGAARGTSGLGLESFMHGITVQRAGPAALASIGPAVMQLARMEGLEAHARAVCMRLEQTP